MPQVCCTCTACQDLQCKFDEQQMAAKCAVPAQRRVMCDWLKQYATPERHVGAARQQDNSLLRLDSSLQRQHEPGSRAVVCQTASRPLTSSSSSDLL